MKALKIGVVISLAVLFYVACSTPETTNGNKTTVTSNANSASVAPATPSANLNAGAQMPSGPSNANLGATTMPPSGANLQAAAALYTENKCVSCHGADGKGNPKIPKVPDFTNAEWQKKTTDAEMIETIKNGKKPMPAFKDKLNDDQIKSLVAYVRSFAK